MSASTAGSTRSVLARSTLNNSPMGAGRRQSLLANSYAGSPVERASYPVLGPIGPRIHAPCTRTITRMAPRRASVSTRATPPTFQRPSSSGPLPRKSRDPLETRRLSRPQIKSAPTPTPIQTFRYSHTSQTSPVTPSSTPPNHPSLCLPRQARSSPSVHEVSPRAPACPTRTTIQTSSREHRRTRYKCTTPAG